VSEIKLTKNELRAQQNRLTQLKRYLPTLQLKKAMLQIQVNQVRIEIQELQQGFEAIKNKILESAGLLHQKTSIVLSDITAIEKINKSYENIAGVDIPTLQDVVFKPLTYNLFETPPWVDGVVEELRQTVHAKVAVLVAEEKKIALEKELHEVSIRVNLFEKVLIPRALKNIKKIKVFLGDQQLAAVSQAKVAKGKIIARKLKKIIDKREVSHAH